MLKKLLYTLLFICSQASYAVNFVIDYAIFSTEDLTPYIEIYLSVNGNSISYANVEGENYQGKLEVTYTIEEGEQVIAFEKFEMNSPLYAPEDVKLDLIDLKRLQIRNGDYLLRFSVKDLITDIESTASQQLENIDFSNSQLAISGIMLANQVNNNPTEQNVFVRNGYEIIPNISHSFIDEQNLLYFYSEIYHADKAAELGEAYLLEYMVIDQVSGEIAADLRHAKRQNAASTSVVLSSFQLDELPSGSYDLVINIKDRNNELVQSKSVPFHRINSSFIDYSARTSMGSFVDTMDNLYVLKEYVKSLYPISSYHEVQFAENQLEYADLDLMQRFFLNFWQTRDPKDPGKAWWEYQEKIKLVDREFGYGNVKGYQTERGRVYLQYGAPDIVQNVPYEADSYPYAIWQYFRLNGVTDRKFVFYSPSIEMLGYKVLHSNVRGENYNPGWEATLMDPSRAINRTDPGNNVINERARDLFNNPR